MNQQYRGFWLGILLLSLATVSPASAKDRAKNQTAITKEQADAILNELKQIHLLLADQQKAGTIGANPAPPPVRVKLSEGGYSLGRLDAPLTLVEFSDYQCPFCEQFQAKTFQELRKNYIDTGKLRFVARDLPLDFHTHALPAAQAAWCGGEQGKYWEIRDVLAKHPNQLEPDAILDYGRQLGLDMPRFRTCMDKQEFLPQINKEIAEAQTLGISGTPSFVLGKTDKSGIEGTLLVGTMPYTSLDEKMRDLLSPETK
ncbi:MAG TPA: thioredoxin domain-containing protein [Terriglobia bacterium]|nr:thioredoxin domain-containing protein [Terriglobia bacterium]